MINYACHSFYIPSEYMFPYLIQANAGSLPAFEPDDQANYGQCCNQYGNQGDSPPDVVGFVLVLASHMPSRQPNQVCAEYNEHSVYEQVDLIWHAQFITPISFANGSCASPRYWAHSSPV